MENNKRKRDINTFEENFSNDIDKPYGYVRKRRIRPSSPKVTQLRSKEFEEFQESEILENSKELEESKEINLQCYEKFEDFNVKNVTVSLPPMCHCIECFAYMGEMNPRQYCCKTNCSYSDFEASELLAIQVYNLRKSPYYDDPTFIYYSEYHYEIQNFITQNDVLVTANQTQSLSLDDSSESDDQTQTLVFDFKDFITQ